MQEENGQAYITLISDNPLKVSAFDVVVHFENDTLVQSVSTVQPFTVVSNIQNGLRKVNVVGYVGDPNAQYPPVNKNHLAGIGFSGENRFNISVTSIEDFDRTIIPVNNIMGEITPVITPEPLPTYSVTPGYVAPVSLEGGIDSSFDPGVPAFGAPQVVTSTPTNSPSMSVRLTSPTNTPVVGEAKVGTGGEIASTGNAVTQIPVDQNVPGQSPQNPGKKASAPLSVPIVLASLGLGCCILLRNVKHV